MVMRPPILPDTLSDLIEAGTAIDCQLELALFRAGIIAPTDLGRVRALLKQFDLEIRAGFDLDLRRRLTFWCDGTLTGVLTADGEIHHFTTVARSRSSHAGSSNLNAAS